MKKKDEKKMTADGAVPGQPDASGPPNATHPSPEPTMKAVSQKPKKNVAP